MKPENIVFGTGWTSDKGCVRDENEDACLAAPEVGLWAVADGMGGHEGGRFASETTVAALRQVPPSATAAALREACEGAIVQANETLLKASAARGGAVIGSTLALLLVHDNFYACIWAGDSRIHLVRNGVIRQLTRDHTEVEDLIARGVLTREEGQKWPRRNVITRAIGVSLDVAADMTSGDIEPGDVFVLCSDGLTAHVSEAEIADVASTGPAQTACDALLGMTLERGATDNVTVVIVRIERGSSTIVQPAARKVPWTKPHGG